MENQDKKYQNNSTENKNEIPVFVRFFVDSRKPLALRVLLFLILLIIFVYPLFAKKKNQVNVSNEIKSESPLNPIDQIEVEKVIDSSKEKPQNKETYFAKPKKIENISPTAVTIKENENGDLWLISKKDVNFFPNGNITEHQARLNSSIYDHLVNNEIPDIVSASFGAENELLVGFSDGQVMSYGKYDWKVVWDSREPINEPIKALGNSKSFNFIGGKGLWKWNTLNNKLSRYKGFNEELVVDFLTSKSKQLFMISTHSIWLFTEQGWEEFFKIEDQTNSIITLEDFGNNGFLIGTEKGLFLVSASAILQQTSLVDQQIYSINSVDEKSFFVATNKGLKYWENGNWYQLSKGDFLKEDLINLVFQDQNSRVWLSFPNNGTFIVDKSSLLEEIKKYPYKEAPPKKEELSYNNACRAVEGELVNASSSGDISVENLDNTKHVFLKGKLACPQGLAFRRSNGSVVKFEKDKISTFNLPEISEVYALPHDFLGENEKPKFIFLDSANRIWLGANKGIAYYQNGNWEKVFEQAEFEGNTANTIIEDKQGRIWFGSKPIYDSQTNSIIQSPLHRFDGTNWIHLSPREGLSGWIVNDILAQENGDLVIATNEGISLVTSDNIKSLGNLSQLKYRNVFSVNQDNLGRIWLAHYYYSNGINVFLNNKYHSLEDENINSQKVFSINFDASNRIWITNSSGKVEIYKQDKFNQYLE